MALFYILFLLFSVTCLADPLINSCDGNTFKLGSQVSKNIDSLLPKLVSKATQDFFANSSYGVGQDRVLGLAQCRGDISITDCSSCLNDAAKQIRESCPSQDDAKILYDYCLLRYSKSDFIGEVDTSGIIYFNVDSVTDPKAFAKQLSGLVGHIRKQALKPKNKGLGKDKLNLTPFVTLYALVQCTRDLSQLSCAQCLAVAFENFETSCKDKKGCRVVFGSCYVRYELYPFYFPLDSKVTPNPTDTRTSTAIISRKVSN